MSMNFIDKKSLEKAYSIFDSGFLDTLNPGTVQCLQQIHAYLFGGLYDFAGKIRTKTISKGGTLFCRAEYLLQNLDMIWIGARLTKRNTLTPCTEARPMQAA